MIQEILYEDETCISGVPHYLGAMVDCSVYSAHHHEDGHEEDVQIWM